MPIQTREELTPREWALYEQEKEAFERQASHAVEIKRLELEAVRLESKFGVWFKIPLEIIKLPVKIVVGLAVVVYAVRGIEPPETVVKLLK